MPDKLEGLDEAKLCALNEVVRQENEEVGGAPLSAGDIIDIAFDHAARLYAQGRTQSVPTEQLADTDTFVSNGKRPIRGPITKDYDLFSTAPPVTAPIEKVDGLAEAVDRQERARNGNGLVYSPYAEKACEQILADDAKIRQAARLQLQRQGD